MRDLVAALDTSILLAERGVRPDAAGSVQRHCPAYRRRGALKEFLIATVQGAGEVGISARDAALLACAHFELDFVNKAEFERYFCNTVRPQFRRFRRHGLAENMPSTGLGGMLWRWKTSLPTLAELALLADLPSSEAYDGTEDEAGHQVAFG